MRRRVGYLASHPIQYYTPLFRELARRCDLTVYFAHRQDAAGQGQAGYGVGFDWDVDLLSGYENRFLENVARVPSTQSFAGCNTPGIADLISQGRFDAFVVPGWSLRSYWQAVRACRRARVPVMVRGDSQLAGQRRGAVGRVKGVVFPHMLKQFDACLYVGRRNREYLEHYGVPAGRMFFSPHCVDNDFFRRLSDGARTPRAADGRRRVLFVGRLVDSKRPLDVAQAVSRLSADGQPVELVVAGAGELRGRMEEAARTGGVDARFLGFVNQSQLPSVYASSDVLVLPSTAVETWGLVVNEAMACGVPAVVSDAVGCGPDLIEPGITGAVAPLDDVPALAAAISSVLALDIGMTRRALAERMETYSPARAADGLLEAADALASGNRLR
ncbi:MAG: glycosyltransferase family 1 protein [Reyranella sp.]|uniref:glycosyltransferase family 4 protein n=1 Tax=Reyranella sp. TaxID=1929291 RepID=UPI0012047598|nr:glycosyltransferase family 4 protein [Reyranella sp.]TAJ85275.1 MAG: glycosyltransferase family 1 protein [Reyranella sp.]TBR30516.1 MAG: glycosyltransferase family 1 protein [Reyranella sp.]